VSHRQRDHREHQERADEQRHQRQHREVDAVGTRQIRGALRRFVGRQGCDFGGQLPAFDQRVAVAAGCQAQIDARQLAGQLEVRLRCRDVDHRQRPAACGHAAGHAQRQPAQPRLHGDVLAVAQPQLLARRSVEEQRLRIEQRERTRRFGASWQQIGRQRSDHQAVDAQYAQADALAGLSARIGVDLQHRAGHLHRRIRRHALEQLVVEALALPAQAQVGLAIGRAHRGRELRQGRLVDDVHRPRQRHAQRHRQHHHRVTPGMVAPFAPRQGEQQAQHLYLVNGRRVPALRCRAP
jgi:hypothetical protein